MLKSVESSHKLCYWLVSRGRRARKLFTDLLQSRALREWTPAAHVDMRDATGAPVMFATKSLHSGIGSTCFSNKFILNSASHRTHIPSQI